MSSDPLLPQGESTAGSSISATGEHAPPAASPPVVPLVMQLVLPRRLPSLPGWSTGPLIAQGAHAATAILALTSDRPMTREYLSAKGLAGGMHKVVLQFPAKGKTTTKRKKKDRVESKEGMVGVGKEEGQEEEMKEEEEDGLEVLSQRLTEARQEWEQQQKVKQHGGYDGDGQGIEEEEEFPPHTLWIEQPEGMPTCIAIAPNRKPATLKKILNKCALFRG